MAYGTGSILPFDKQQYDYWSSEITRAERLRDDKLVAWDVDGNLKRYAPEHVKKADAINVGADFSDAERKKAGLLFDTPSIVVLPDPETHPTAAALHQDLLNELLSERQVNAKATALKAILANLTVIQPSPTKIGYVPTIVPTPQVGPDGQPVMVPVVVHEEFFWTKISERSLLLPVDLRDTDYDRAAPWIGYKFRMPVSQLRRAFTVDPALAIPASDGERKLYFTDDQVPQGEDADDPICTGTYIEYRAALVDPKVSHPGLIRCLVLVDGLETPVKHEDASWQIDPVTQQFNPRAGFTGFSIHPLALRDLPDSAWVPADSTITAQLTHEINDFLTDMKRQREGNRLAVMYDPSKIAPEMVDRIEQGKTPGFIPVKGLSEGGKDVMVAVTQVGNGREHYLGLDVFQGARERILGISANTVGAEDDGEKTATEISAVTRNTEARFEQERQRVLEWFLAGVQKLSALVVRYGDRLAVEVLGPQRGQQWVQARDQGMLGPFRFDVQVDGGKYLDIRAERKQWLDFYNLTAKDPNTRRVVVLKKLASAWGLDPNEFVVDELPEPKPEPPKVNFSVSAADLNPMLPQFPLVVEVLRLGGIALTPASIQLAQQQAQTLPLAARNTTTGEAPNDPVEAMSNASPAPVAGVGPDPKSPQPPPHGGAADTADRINQHQLALTGNRSGPPA